MNKCAYGCLPGKEELPNPEHVLTVLDQLPVDSESSV